MLAAFQRKEFVGAKTGLARTVLRSGDFDDLAQRKPWISTTIRRTAYEECSSLMLQLLSESVCKEACLNQSSRVCLLFAAVPDCRGVQESGDEA